MPRLTIVSAADATYFRCLLQLAASIERHRAGREWRTMVYDLGWTDAQRRQMADHFPFVEVRPFDFSRYPAFVGIRPRAVNTNGWKPQILRAVLSECDHVVLWLDSATVMLAPPDPAVAWTERTGLYAPFGGTSTNAELTHPAALAALGADAAIAALRQRASGVLGFDARQPRIRALVDRWAEVCLDERVIAPPGWTRANHRFDQSALNVLIAQERGLELTADELDISSDRPTPLFRTRNKVPSGMPLWMDPLLRVWFAAYRAADVALLKIRRARRASRRRG